MSAAPGSAATALRADLASVLRTNFAAYQALAGDYRATSRQRLRHAARWLARVFRRTPPDNRGRALDIGCADGSHAYYLADHGYEVTAVDFSPRMIELAMTHEARARSRSGHLPRFLLGEFLDGSFCDAAGQTEHLRERQFDLVVANAFVHLFPEPVDRTVVQRALELVAHQGTALFSTTIEETRREGYFSKHRSTGPHVERWRGEYPKEEFLALISDAAGQAFDIHDQITYDMRGKSWLTVSARRTEND